MMKTLTHGSVLLSIILFITYVFAYTYADDYTEADYMSDLMILLSPTPSGWSNRTHQCNWNGVVCNSNQVVAINLPSSSLTGRLPINIYILSNLTHIDLHNNSLTGDIPFFGGLQALQTVYLGHNNFTALSNSPFRFIPHLQTLNLSNNLNLYPWTFPVNFINSPQIHTLDLEATNLMGQLPSDMFVGSPSLHTLFLSHNNLSGTLPLSLGYSGIRYLRVNDQGFNSGFTGTIEVLSSMRFLSQAWLNFNLFKGIIPDFTNCTHLFDLQLKSNSLTGLVPPSLLALSSLKNISLDYNLLQGPIPVFLKGVKATWENNLFCRRDVGPCDIQVTILLEISEAIQYPGLLSDYDEYENNACNYGESIGCQRGKIVSINLRNQELEGTISPQFSNLTSLVNLTLSGNNLSGTIPKSLTILPHLQLLNVSDNNLSGPIPIFPSNVKFITSGNPLLGLNISRGIRRRGLSKAKLRYIWIAGASMCSVGIVILVLIICKRKRYYILIHRGITKKIKKSTDQNVDDFIQRYNLTVPIKQFRYSEVKRMTNSFQEKLGQGGYGVVYKASLSDGRQVAVKVINESKGDGEEFINEVASISRTSHVNIVSLLGFCYENKRALIYEFMPKGSLDKFILKSGFHDATCSLDWNTLYKIAIGIARGLEYLHQGCTSRILHLDIKPQNILLDEDFCPKISDFGLAKICQRNDSIVSMLGTRGTIGYIAPEVFSRTYGGVSHKSDVYSYGMLILEMIGGRKNYDTKGSCTSEMYFPDWIYKELEQNNVVDSLANSNEESDLVRMITMISLWCIQTNPSNRPSMSKVIEMLQGPLQSMPYPPKPLLHSPEITSLQTSIVSSSNFSETNSIRL